MINLNPSRKLAAVRRAGGYLFLLALMSAFFFSNAPLSTAFAQGIDLESTNTSIIGWGYDNEGEAYPPPGLANVTALATSFYVSMALKRDGTVVAWGWNGTYGGQTNVPAGLSNVVQVAAGPGFALALKSDGTVVAWAAANDGGNDAGEANVPAGLSNVVAVSAGGATSLALKRDGTVIAWGDNQYGQANVPAGLTNVVAISAGADFNLALKSDGTVIAWGNNEFGATDVPTGLSNVVAVSGGGSFGMALKSNGTVVAWGTTVANYVLVAESTLVPAGLSNVVQVVAGDGHSLALKSDGTVVAWGDDSYGQANVPTGLRNVIALAPGCTANDVLALQYVVPALNILDSGNAVMISWPAVPGWNLQQNSDLSTTNWMTPSGAVTYDGTNDFINVDPQSGTQIFFRLIQ